jgi:hypothetical protein
LVLLAALALVGAALLGFEQPRLLGQVLAAAWGGAALVGLLAAMARPAPGLRRLATASLGLTGASVPVALWLTAERSGVVIVGGSHGWYFGRFFPVLGLVSLVLLTLGLMGAAPGVRPRAVRLVGITALVSGGAAGVVALGIGRAGASYAPDPPADYSGDYLVLAFHLTVLVAAAVLLAVGALLCGQRRAEAQAGRTGRPWPLLVVAVALVVAGCGTERDPGPAAPTTTSTTALSAPRVQGAPLDLGFSASSVNGVGQVVGTASASTLERWRDV